MKIEIDVKTPMQLDRPDDELCLRLAVVTIRIPVFSKVDQETIWNSSHEEALRNFSEWLDRKIPKTEKQSMPR